MTATNSKDYCTMQHSTTVLILLTIISNSSCVAKPACQPDPASHSSGIWQTFCWAQLVETDPTTSQPLDQLRLWVSSLLLHSWGWITWFATWQVGTVLPPLPLSTNPFNQRVNSAHEHSKMRTKKSPKHSFCQISIWSFSKLNWFTGWSDKY